MSTRNKSTLKINAMSALILQIVVAVIGIFLPRLILAAFGSEVHGLTSSITQFLSYISLMEAGTGSVVKAALFKPLAAGDHEGVSATLNACKKFFRTIALIFLAYVLILAVIYPFFSANQSFTYDFIFTLVLILGISTFSQYFFCLTYRILLQADQKIYFDNFLQIITLILNFIMSAVLIYGGAGIRMVKLVSALVCLITPIAINIYVRKKYSINKKAVANKDSLKNRWDGLGHHIAFFVHKNTDIVILTFFSNLNEVSVYAVYNMIVSAIQGLLSSLSSSVTSKFGELFAKDDKSKLELAFSQYETLIFAIATLLFSITGIMIIPFVEYYTMDIIGVNYIRPWFAYFIVFAEFIYAIRAPYSNLVFAVGEFKETRNGAIIEAIINIVISISLVWWLGIIGVAIGTLAAMLYRTLDYVIYLNKHVIHRPIKIFVKNILMNTSVFVLGLVLCNLCILPLFTFNSFLIWTVCAVIVSIIMLVLIFAFQMLFNKKYFLSSLKFFLN